MNPHLRQADRLFLFHRVHVKVACPGTSVESNCANQRGLCHGRSREVSNDGAKYVHSKTLATDGAAHIRQMCNRSLATR